MTSPSPKERASHTEGPWEWIAEDKSMVTLTGADGAHVLTATICNSCQASADTPHWKWGRCYTANEQDARLIASAPDLVKALQEVMEWIDERKIIRLDGDWSLQRAALSRSLPNQ